jgi:hypothetical protein
MAGTNVFSVPNLWVSMFSFETNLGLLSTPFELSHFLVEIDCMQDGRVPLGL